MSGLKELIAQGEHQRQDFKQEITSSLKIAKTLVAFANTDGGKILVGVKDNGVIYGINPEEEKYMIEGAASLYSRPPVPVVFEVVEEEGRSVLIASVAKSPLKPHFAKDEDNKWWAYIRVDDHTHLASKVMLEVLKRDNDEGKTLIRFQEEEKNLLQYLLKHRKVTLKEFCKNLKVPRNKAIRILINLISARIVKVGYENSGIDVYYLSEESDLLHQAGPA